LAGASVVISLTGSTVAAVLAYSPYNKLGSAPRPWRAASPLNAFLAKQGYLDDIQRSNFRQGQAARLARQVLEVRRQVWVDGGGHLSRPAHPRPARRGVSKLLRNRPRAHILCTDRLGGVIWPCGWLFSSSRSCRHCGVSTRIWELIAACISYTPPRTASEVGVRWISPVPRRLRVPGRRSRRGLPLLMRLELLDATWPAVLIRLIPDPATARRFAGTPLGAALLTSSWSPLGLHSSG